MDSLLCNGSLCILWRIQGTFLTIRHVVVDYIKINDPISGGGNTRYTRLQVLEQDVTVDAVQENQCTPQSEALHKETAKARMRMHELEHKCRQLSRSADEASVLQSQLDLMSKESTEWQQRYTCDLFIFVFYVVIAMCVTWLLVQGRKTGTATIHSCSSFIQT